MAKSINKALTDLFIGLGGNTADLADNKSVSDYIADLESAIKAAAAAELPGAADLEDGTVLGVIAGEWVACTISAEADSVTGDITVTLEPVEPADNT